jgi:hypothetical protein
LVASHLRPIFQIAPLFQGFQLNSVCISHAFISVVLLVVLDLSPKKICGEWQKLCSPPSCYSLLGPSILLSTSFYLRTEIHAMLSTLRVCVRLRSVKISSRQSLFTHDVTGLNVWGIICRMVSREWLGQYL